MQAWQERVLNERDDAQQKLTNLLIFTNTNAFEELHPMDSALMVSQAQFMAQYVHCLNARIVRFVLD